MFSLNCLLFRTLFNGIFTAKRNEVWHNTPRYGHPTFRVAYTLAKKVAYVAKLNVAFWLMYCDVAYLAT